MFMAQRDGKQMINTGKKIDYLCSRLEDEMGCYQMKGKDCLSVIMQKAIKLIIELKLYMKVIHTFSAEPCHIK